MKARYDIYCDGLKVASAEGPQDQAEREAWHYAWEYEQDGKVDVYRIEGKSKVRIGDE